jgi:hypothetical protein
MKTMGLLSNSSPGSTLYPKLTSTHEKRHSTKGSLAHTKDPRQRFLRRRYLCFALSTSRNKLHSAVLLHFPKWASSTGITPAIVPAERFATHPQSRPPSPSFYISTRLSMAEC